MATIQEENRKHLRQALHVSCGFRETDAEPTSMTAANNVKVLDGLVNMDPILPGAILMDLAGQGFKNTGEAIPMETDTDSYGYGYISSGVAQSNGTFANKPSVTLRAAKTWDIITIALRGQYGETEVIKKAPVWAGNKTTIYIDSWIPGERVYITGVFLGMTWLWNNDNLLSVNLDLRGVNTEIGGELEVSSIEIEAYERTDYTDIIGRFQEGSPIWYSAGYAGDMSRKRKFYLSEPVTWDDNILRVCGQDLTPKLDNYRPTMIESYGSTTSVDLTIVERVEDALSEIQYEVVGHTPPYSQRYVLAAQVFYYVGENARSIISQYTDVYRDGTKFAVAYVDAGIPTLMYGNIGAWRTIYADEIADLISHAEANINRIEIHLPEYYTQWSDNIAQVETTAGKNYFVDLDPPVYLDADITPTPTSFSTINPEKFTFKAAASTTYTISGWQALSDETAGNNPFVAQGSGTGVTKKLDFTLPLLIGDSPDKSLTHDAIVDLLNRSNIVYEFTYRGNPHIQPRDVLNVELATWEDREKTIAGLYPALDLYPAADLYPFGKYRTVRRMVKTWEIMTVDSIRMEHTEGGGFSSKITARKGVV